MFFFYKCIQEARVPVSSLRHNQQWKIPPTNQEYSKGKVWAGICFFWCNTDKKQLHILIQFFYIFTCNWDIMINCVAGEDNGADHDNTINPYKEDKKLPT